MVRLCALITERHDPQQTGSGGAGSRGRARASDRPARRALRAAPRDAADAAGHAYPGVRRDGGGGGVFLTLPLAGRVDRRRAAKAVGVGVGVVGPRLQFTLQRSRGERRLPTPPSPPARSACSRGRSRSTRRPNSPTDRRRSSPGAACATSSSMPKVPERIATEWWRDERGPRAHARLFPRRKPRWRARLAFPRMAGRSATCAALVRARRVRMSNVVAFPDKEKRRRTRSFCLARSVARLRGACRHHQFLLPARRVASGRPGAAGRSARPRRHRHRGPQQRRRRGARLQRVRAAQREHLQYENPGVALPPFKLAVGARLVFADGTPDILAYPQNRTAWGRLTRLLTVGKSRGEKAECILFFDDLLEHIAGLNLIVMPPARFKADALGAVLTRLQSVSFRQPVWLAASMLYRGDDNRRLARLKAIAETTFVPLIAVNDVLYHVPERRPLQDVMTCIREHVTIDRAGRLLEANAERHLKGPAGDGAHLPPRAGCDRPHAALPRPLQFLARRTEADRISGREPHRLCDTAGCARGARRGRIPAPLSRTAPIRKSARRSTRSWTSHPILTTRHTSSPCTTSCDFARSRGILCQGRGSAANSVICYCLEITEVNPEKIDLLFERFVSEERKSRPTSTSTSSTSGARR